jgi:DNA-binding SARP family transcriptional activator
MIDIKVVLMGRFAVWCGERPTEALNNRRARELLSYLLLHRGRPLLRESLAGVLWEDAPPDQARKYLRQALWLIQAVVQDGGGTDPGEGLQADAEWIQFDVCAGWEADVVRFEEATHRCHGIPGSFLDDLQCRVLERAVSSCRGQLLEGWYKDWCVFERERFENDLYAALEKLTACYQHRRDTERGLECARRILAIDPANEMARCHVMQLHMIAGNRTEALREYERCEMALKKELGVGPSSSTRALNQSIRDDRWNEFETSTSVTAGTRDDAHKHLMHLMKYVQKAKIALSEIEARVGRELPSGTPDAGLPELGGD